MDSNDTFSPSSKNKKSLGLLAEVALTRHYEEQQNDTLSQPIAPKTKIISRHYSLKQIRKLSEKKLISTFAELKKDLKNKYYSYKCQILPQECEALFESYESEHEELKSRMALHLIDHVCNLEQTLPNTKIYSCRKVRTRKRKTNSACSPEPSNITSSITTTNAFTPTTTTAKADNEAKLLVIKFLETDHAYTIPTMMDGSNDIANSRLIAPVVATKGSTPASVVMIRSNERNNISDSNAIRIQSNSPKVLMVGKEGANQILTTQKVVESKQPLEQNIPPKGTNSTPVPVSPTMRALALDYIDDIRKKSSSAGKSIVINGDKSIIYQCKICPDKQFTSTNGLIFHYKKHAGLKPYVCELCSATFTRQHSLNYHMLIHLNKSRFVCSECSRHFRHPSHFKEHMRRHTGETPFQCSDCLIRFKTRNTYKRHLQTKHAKILTSKGIIELSNAMPFQSVPKTNSGTTTVSAMAGGSSSTAVLPNATTVVVKPRRKYGIRFLHKNIETISNYEKSRSLSSTLVDGGSGVPGTATTLITTAEAANLISTGCGGGVGSLPVSIAAQTAPGSNITILSIPQPMNTVHILDNSGMITAATGGANLARISKPLADYNQQNGLTLLSYQPSSTGPTAVPATITVGTQSNTEIVNKSPMIATNTVHVLEPVCSGGIITNHHQNSVQQTNSSDEERTLTTLMPSGKDSGTVLDMSNTDNSVAVNLSVMNNTASTYQQMIPSTVANDHQMASTRSTTNNTATTSSTTATSTTTATNDNFMRLLEAIALTEVVDG